MAAFKSSIKAVAVLGMALSMISLAAHFILARYYTAGKPSDELLNAAAVQPSLGWLHEETDSPDAKAWKAVKALQLLRPHSSPRENYPVPSSTGYLYAEIRGDFHEIRSSICDLIVVARLLNVTLVIPRLKEVVAKQISPKFKGFDYLYDEQHFISALADDVPVVKNLPSRYRPKKKNFLMVTSATAVEFYVQEVLPEIKKDGFIGLSVSGGGCLQSFLGPEFADYQRLRCRVAFHALRFRREVQDLAIKMLSRLRASGKPYLALYSGLERETLAYHGCAERFQDIHAELIQTKRAKMIKSGLVRGDLNVDSEMQWLNGSCPLMPEEVGVLLRSLGYKRSTRLYIAGVEVFGGQRVLLPLRSMFPNLEDRTTLTTARERFTVYGEEHDFPPPPPFILPKIDERARLAAWAKAGPRPRPLPPPAGRPKYSHELEGWWGWIGESDTEPPPGPKDSRIRGHKLLWQALDYIICTEADAFFSAFDEDRSGHPNFASLVMGHRAYAGASRRTFRPDRKPIANLLVQVREHVYDPGREWMAAARNLLLKSVGEDGIVASSLLVKPASFLSHPLPECVCRVGKRNQSTVLQRDSDGRVLYGDEEGCPDWMKAEAAGVIDEQDSEQEQEEVADDVFEGEEGTEGTTASSTTTTTTTAKESVVAESDKADDGLLTEGDEENDPND